MAIQLNQTNAGKITLTTEDAVGTPYQLSIPNTVGTFGTFWGTNGAGLVTFVAATNLAFGNPGSNAVTPNDVIKIGFLQNSTASSTVNVFRPKGTGANIFSNHPSSGSIYGNARGAYATEINMVDTWDADTDVASGTGSVAVGTKSKAAGAYSVALGYKSSTTSDYSVAIGRGQLGSNAQYSVSIGRGSYTTTPTVYGSQNQYSVSLTTDTPSGGSYQAHLGGSGNALTTGVYGATIMPNWVFGPYTSNVGTNIAKRFIYSGALRTTSATSASVYADSASATGNGYFKLEANSISAIDEIVVVAAVTTSGGDCKAWRFQNGGAAPTSCAIYKTDGTNTVTTINAVTLSNSYASAGASTWTAAVSVDNTNRALTVTVTGQAATTIQWFVWMSIDSLTYA